jgi:hypothetical protein
MSNTDPAALIWRKSSFSESGNCVEVAIPDDESAHTQLVHIRDSKNPNGGVLSMSSSSWREFTDRIRRNIAI